MNQRLGIGEFTEVLEELISPMIVNRNYIKTYYDFWNNLVFKMFENYYFSTVELPVSHYAKMVDIFFGNLFQFDSAAEKVEDILDL